MILQTFRNSTDLRANSVSLLLCWHIRVGLFRDVEPARIQAYCSFFYQGYLEPYFQRLESRMNLDGMLHKDILQKLEVERNKVKKMCHGAMDRRRFKSLEDKLEEYTWYEHRVLHTTLFHKLPSEEFELWIKQETDHSKAFLKHLNFWEDKFWELK